MATTTTTTTIPSFAPLSFLAAILLLASPTLSNPSPVELKISDISAAPAFLPTEPKISSIPPTLAPDMMPLFPSPGGNNTRAAPAGTLPTIPSSPSPPNPDELQPNSAIAPSGSAAETSAANSPGNVSAVSLALVSGLVLMWWLELVDK